VTSHSINWCLASYTNHAFTQVDIPFQRKSYDVHFLPRLRGYDVPINIENMLNHQINVHFPYNNVAGHAPDTTVCCRIFEMKACCNLLTTSCFQRITIIYKYVHKNTIYYGRKNSFRDENTWMDISYIIMVNCCTDLITCYQGIYRQLLWGMFESCAASTQGFNNGSDSELQSHWRIPWQF
jgi:hypothetical protein